MAKSKAPRGVQYYQNNNVTTIVLEWSKFNGLLIVIISSLFLLSSLSSIINIVIIPFRENVGVAIEENFTSLILFVLINLLIQFTTLLLSLGGVHYAIVCLANKTYIKHKPNKLLVQHKPASHFLLKNNVLKNSYIEKIYLNEVRKHINSDFLAHYFPEKISGFIKCIFTTNVYFLKNKPKEYEVRVVQKNGQDKKIVDYINNYEKGSFIVQKLQGLLEVR